MSEHTSDINNRAIAIWFVLFGIVVILMVVPLRSYFYEVRNDVIHETVLSVADPRLDSLRVVEDEALTTYGWVDEENRVVRIPIERAMELMVKEAGKPAGEGE